MLIGKKFNGAVRGFTLVFYSLKIIHIAAFIHWCRTFDHFEGCMIKWKTVKCLIMACECCYRSRCTFGQITPSEAALKRHSLRTSLQSQIWTASHVAKLHIPSPLECRWQRWNESPQPVYFGGPMSADVSKDHGKKNISLLRGKPCMYRFMLLPRVRMVQTCTNAYIERGYKSGNRTINVFWNILKLLLCLFIEK
jgi:hypothetical protein